MTEQILKGRLALISGASRGIGRETAKAFAKAGAHVIAVARTVGALEELDDEIRTLGGTATLVPIDLTDYDALDRLGLTIHERWGRLDILVGNGAMLGTIGPLNHIDPKVFERVMAVNVTANYRLIRSMDPLLRASDAGRALFLSSSAGSNAFAYWGLYGASKAALDLMCRDWAEEVRNVSAIKVMLVNPGRTRTRMRAEAAPGEDPMTLPTPDEITPYLVEMATPAWQQTGKWFDFPKRKVMAFRAPE
ncbi:SDR family NAD(P)-dependent oxidoreductase [Rhabdaerophilum sp. SD176]|uniref:SDR family NAD(P)-dependent oxidoreductase n=1 Tax=Rhabdaerophilum sp. SD176 TaxID=2983548 RepID=UPI0024DF81F8|nr:SDR family NAD(P)-dependent oxidoreductase [Rhabdaerophilum sp. SD176]